MIEVLMVGGVCVLVVALEGMNMFLTPTHTVAFGHVLALAMWAGVVKYDQLRGGK